MPGESYYNMGVKDFFYNKDTANKIITSIPFDTENFKTWLFSSNSKNKYEGKYDGNVFMSNVVNYVTDNSLNFINIFLPGNINLSQNINTTTSNVTGGSIMVNSSKFDLNPNPTKESGYNSYNVYQSNTSAEDDNQYMELNSSGNSVMYNKKDITNSSYRGGVTRTYISLNTKNPKCQYTTNCTAKHEYNDCHTQIVKEPDGGTHCKCICNATGKIGDGVKPHTHCSPINIDENTTLINDINNNSYNISSSGGGGGGGEGSNSFYQNYINNSKLLSAIQSIKLRLNLDESDNTDTSPVNIQFDIRNLIYKYYIEIYRNIDYQKQIQNYQSNPSEQALSDANNLYKHKYLDLFNVLSGIFLVSSYIYILTRVQKQ